MVSQTDEIRTILSGLGEQEVSLEVQLQKVPRGKKPNRSDYPGLEGRAPYARAYIQQLLAESSPVWDPILDQIRAIGVSAPECSTTEIAFVGGIIAVDGAANRLLQVLDLEGVVAAEIYVPRYPQAD